MPIINKFDAKDHLCPFNNFKPCFGAFCMAWVDAGNPYQFETTNNLTTNEDGVAVPVGAPPKPRGKGWEKDGAEALIGYHRSQKDDLPKARQQRWVKFVGTARGKCGRNFDGGF
jgi:hypothetical protein